MDPAAHASSEAAPQDFFRRARARLTLDIPPGLTDPDILPKRGDHNLDPVFDAIGAIRPIKPAAVLVGIVERPEPMVLLTQRTAHLPDHAGQIAFLAARWMPATRRRWRGAARNARGDRAGSALYRSGRLS